MWITLLVMAAAVCLEPFRVSMTVVLINRPRPMPQLLAFLAGGFTMGTAVGVLGLFVLRPAMGLGHFTLPRVQMAVGVLLLVSAVVIVTRLAERMGGRAGGEALGRAGRVFEPLAPRARQLVEGRPLWTAGAAGLGMALPSFEYLGALALIVATGAEAAVQLGALLLFNVVAFGFVELPLLCYLVAPNRTRATLSALQEWLQSRRRVAVSVMLAAVGCVLLGAGLAGV